MVREGEEEVNGAEGGERGREDTEVGFEEEDGGPASP